jgi:hypothetical protein
MGEARFRGPLFCSTVQSPFTDGRAYCAQPHSRRATMVIRRGIVKHVMRRAAVVAVCSAWVAVPVRCWRSVWARWPPRRRPMPTSST